LPGGLEDWETIDVPPNSQKPNHNFPFLFVEGNLGIPKKVLRALYLIAVSMNFNRRTSTPREIIAATSTIILLNPAHQTALNVRKYLMEKDQLDPKNELLLTELIARGSPEVAKQSIIWDHRRWCFRRIYGQMKPTASLPSLRCCATSDELQFFPKMNPAGIHEEIAIIKHTCETYPRNYHSWAHWNYIMNICYASVYIPENNEGKQDFLNTMVGEYANMRSWVAQHVSDYSAMVQLFQLEKLIEQLKLDGLLAINSYEDAPSGSLDYALSLVEAFPTHEGLWLYLRLILGELTPEEKTRILEHLPNSGSPFKERLVSWFSRKPGDGSGPGKK